MGWIMRGMEARPVAVGNHSWTNPGNSSGDRRTAARVALTRRLMVAPGIMTLAKDCHTNVSEVARTVSWRRVVVGLVLDEEYTSYPLETESAAQYPNAST